MGTSRAESADARNSSKPQTRLHRVRCLITVTYIRSSTNESSHLKQTSSVKKQTGHPDFSGRPVRVKQTGALLDYDRRRRIANAPIRPTPTNATVEGSGTAVNESGVNSGGKDPDCVTNPLILTGPVGIGVPIKSASLE